MKIRNEVMKVNILVLTMQSAWLVTSLFPQTTYAVEDEADAYGLKHPSNSVEFGALYASQHSAKFGEYNGLNEEGFYGIGSFDVRGGSGYDEKDSALRWWLGGSNIGTTSRTFAGKISDQGKWSVSVGYDELRHNITDTFQTPQRGNTGGNDFNLPGDFGGINAQSDPGTRVLTPSQQAPFHTEKESTTRRNAPFSASYIFTPQFSAQLDYNHLEQTGAKLVGTGSQGGISLLGGSTGRAEAVNIIMNPTSYSTDNINAALNWVGDNAHLTGGYYGSLFHDNYNSLNWQSPLTSNGASCQGSACYVNNSMSTAPTNSFHQANLSGGYDFSSTTKLAGEFSYGYNAQDDSYAPTRIVQANGSLFDMMQANGLPVASLNGHVETKHGDLKLTDQSIKDLTLTAGFKFNERDNQTDSNIYQYFTIAGIDPENRYTAVNTPYSNKKTQYEVAAAYRLTQGQNLRLAYEREDIRRWCNGVVGGAQCIASPKNHEDKVSLTYRLTAFEDINFNAGYSYAKRNADFDNHFLANSGNYASTAAVNGSALNGGNFLGFVPHPYANRNQHLGKAGVNWQLSQKLDMGLDGRYSYDDYDATLGVQNGRSAGVNIDATYSYDDNSSVSAYWSWQNGRRNLRSGDNGSQVVAPTNIWTNRLEDNSNAFGLLTRYAGLLDGKLEIIGDFSYAFDESSYATQVPYDPDCSTSGRLTCGTLPAIRNELLSLKLTGNYKVHKNGKLSLSYIYQKLNSNDYFYNGQQFGFTPNRLMPTGLQQQDYTVNVVALSYSYSF